LSAQKNTQEKKLAQKNTQQIKSTFLSPQIIAQKFDLAFLSYQRSRQKSFPPN
jgi:hypothetical protein